MYQRAIEKSKQTQRERERERLSLRGNMLASNHHPTPPTPHTHNQHNRPAMNCTRIYARSNTRTNCDDHPQTPRRTRNLPIMRQLVSECAYVRACAGECASLKRMQHRAIISLTRAAHHHTPSPFAPTSATLCCAVLIATVVSSFENVVPASRHIAGPPHSLVRCACCHVVCSIVCRVFRCFDSLTKSRVVCCLW